MTRMTTEHEFRREQVENALAELAKAQKMVDVVTLRMKQAVSRERRLYGLLVPGIEQAEIAAEAVKNASIKIGSVWSAAEGTGWG